jgi:hypothetical protein
MFLIPKQHWQQCTYPGATSRAELGRHWTHLMRYSAPSAGAKSCQTLAKIAAIFCMLVR